MSRSRKRIIISGGGTGGHIFPALSIANALKAVDSSVDILFVGAQGRMEMEKIPAEGYPVRGLPVAGFYRKKIWKNAGVIIKLFKSLRMAGEILREFRPHAVVGVGGYASGPLLRKAHQYGIPSLVQEQNSHAGITNRLLAKKVDRICVAYEGMEKYFPKHKIIITGNPIRENLELLHNNEPLRSSKKAEAQVFFALRYSRPVILVLGGSLGSKSINEAIKAGLPRIIAEEVQLLWQTGKIYFDDIRESTASYHSDSIAIHDFIGRMDLAYSLADVVISRAGAATISELAVVGLPSVLVPSPNVAEDHQTRNAMTLVKRDAALMVRDAETSVRLIDVCLGLVRDEEKKKMLSQNIQRMAQRYSAKRIAEAVFKLIKE